MKRNTVAISVVFVSLLVVEFLLRFFMGNMEIAPFQNHPGDGRCVGLAPGETVTYTGWFWRIDSVEHGANRYGYRGFPHDENPRPGIFRIAALGD